MSPRLRLGLLVGAIAAAAAVVLALVARSPQDIRDFVDGLGVAAPLAFVAISAALSCAFFSSPLLAGASGLLFGTAVGTPISLMAATIAAVLAFSIARHGGRDAVEELVGGRMETWRRRIERNGFLAVLYARIAPAMPFSLVSYTAGVTRIRLVDFAAATAIGAAPRAFAWTALGGHLGDLSSPEALVAVGILVVMAIGGLALALRGWSRSSSPPLRLREHRGEPDRFPSSV